MPNMVEMSRQAQQVLPFNTQGQGLYEITRDVISWTESCPITTGLLTIYCRHTSASLIIQENADPAVLEDLQHFFKQLVPEGGLSYKHAAEGPDDMPAHIKGALTATCLSIPVASGSPTLGVWQGIFLFEHRLQPHTREVILHLTGT